MCNVAVTQFFMEHVNIDEFNGGRALEVGSKYINGSVRPLIEKFCHPREYVGIDIEPGRFVDIVLPVEKMVEHFGPESFDAIISTELLEHVKNWKLAVNNIKYVLRPGGSIYVTTRSRGYPYHGFAYDFWRYEMKDMERIFSDFEITVLETDPEAPGVFLKAKKPNDWKPIDLSNVALYSMILGRRTAKIEQDHMPLRREIDLVVIPKILDKVLGWLYRRLRPSTYVPHSTSS